MADLVGEALPRRAAKCGGSIMIESATEALGLRPPGQPSAPGYIQGSRRGVHLSGAMISAASRERFRRPPIHDSSVGS